MRMLLGCATALLLAGTAARADELDRETKGKTAATTTAATTAPLAGSELDKESPEQSGHYRGRGGYGGGGFRSYGGYGGYRGGYGGYRGGYGGYYRPSYGFGYGSYYPSYYYPSYGYGYSSYRPYGWGINLRF